MILDEFGAEGVESLYMNLLSLKDFLDFSHMFLAASLEKVSARIWDESMFSFSTMYAIFAVMVVVLPMPAPARISWGACVCWMAESWRGFRIERRVSNIFIATLVKLVLTQSKRLIHSIDRIFIKRYLEFTE
jgi:hypothetical protein